MTPCGLVKTFSNVFLSGVFERSSRTAGAAELAGAAGAAADGAGGAGGAGALPGGAALA